MSNPAVSTHLADTVGSCCRSISTMSCTLSRRLVKIMMPPPGGPAKHHTQQVVNMQSTTCSRRCMCATDWGQDSHAACRGQCMQHGVVLGVQVPIYGVAVAHASASQRPNFTELPGV